MKVFTIDLFKFNDDNVKIERLESFINRDAAEARAKELAEEMCQGIRNGIDLGLYRTDTKPVVRRFELGYRVMAYGCDIVRYEIEECEMEGEPIYR